MIAGVLGVAAGATQRNLAAGVALLGPKKPPMGVDDPMLGDLAQPAEHLAVGQIGFGQRTHRLDA